MKDLIKKARLADLWRIISDSDATKIWFGILSLIILGATIGALVTGEIVILGLPAVILFLFLALTNTKALYALLWATIPLSMEVYLPNGLGTDLPSEPLMIGLMGVGLLLVLHKPKVFPFKILLHPISLLVVLHLGWILLTTLTSESVLVSMKFLLAKAWYISAFFMLPFVFFKSFKDLERWVWIVLVPLMITVLYVLFRHAFEGFTFASVSFVLAPFYRNHVNYACTLVIFLPFIVYLWHHAESKSMTKWALLGCIIILLGAIYLSYTRAAYVCLVLMTGMYFVIRFKLVKWAVVGALIAGGVFLQHMIEDNTYIEYAPNYEKTIAHYDFENLVSATYKMEDVSTMERFYRWIAGFYMLDQKPLTGFGPGNFFNFYKSYTDKSFVTYVSDNPENSGIHNYYLMTATEQGLPGIVIFLILLAVALVRGERLYHRLISSKKKYFLVAALLSMTSILFILLLNDMVETDKVGSFFFFNLALIVGLEMGLFAEKKVTQID